MKFFQNFQMVVSKKYVDGNLRHIFIHLIVFATALLVVPAFAKTAGKTSGDIILIYSANNDLCERLTSALNQIQAGNQKALYISQVRSEFFRRTHFSPPPWIDHPDPVLGTAFQSNGGNPLPELEGFRRDGLGYWFGQAFFRADVMGDGKNRLVAVGHEVLGHNGDYQTYLWIFKQNMPYRLMVKTDSSSIDVLAEIDPSVVEMTIGVDKNIQAEFPQTPIPSPTARKLLYLMTGKGSQVPPQEPFDFQGKTYFLAGMPLMDDGLVYQIMPDEKIKAVCLNAQQKLLDSLSIYQMGN